MKKRNEVYDSIVTSVWGYVKNNNVSMKEMAASTGRLADRTLYSRLKNPGEFRLAELVALADKMHITIGEMIGGI